MLGVRCVPSYVRGRGKVHDFHTPGIPLPNLIDEGLRFEIFFSKLVQSPNIIT